MTKLGKGLTLAGGGVPAVAILSVCVLNAHPQAPHSHLAADTIVPPSTTDAIVQPNPLEPAETTVAPDALSDLARQAKPLGGTGTKAKTPQKSKHASTPTPAQAQEKVGAKVAAYAKAQLGVRYVFGGESPRGGFDCSGLAMAAYHAAGVKIPRTSDAQYWFGKRVSAGHERVGDLVYFDYKKGHSGPGHVGIVVNPKKGLMIVAPHTGTVVKYQNYRTYPGGPVGFTRPPVHR